jgi:hypothetical protein
MESQQVGALKWCKYLTNDLPCQIVSQPLLQDNPLRCQPVLDRAPREPGWLPRVDLLPRRKTAIAYLWELITRWQF